MTGHGGNIQP